MKSLFSIACVSLALTSLPSIAAEMAHVGPMASISGKTYYDTLAQWFKAGTPIKPEDASGYYAGRCFERLSPTIPTNAVLVSRTDTPDAGPGLPPAQSTFYFGHVTQYDSQERALPANYYDALKGEDLTKALSKASQILDGAIQAGIISPASVKSEGISWKLRPSAFESYNFGFRLVRSGNYLVLQSRTLHPDFYVHSNTTGDTLDSLAVGPWTYCYFFKKLEQ